MVAYTTAPYVWATSTSSHCQWPTPDAPPISTIRTINPTQENEGVYLRARPKHGLEGEVAKEVNANNHGTKIGLRLYFVIVWFSRE